MNDAIPEKGKPRHQVDDRTRGDVFREVIGAKREIEHFEDFMKQVLLHDDGVFRVEALKNRNSFEMIFELTPFGIDS